MGKIRFQFNHAGVDELLIDVDMRQIVESAAEDVKARAQAQGVMVERGAERHPMPYEVETAIVGDRVQALVIAAHPAGIAAEVKHGTLQRAIDG